MEYAAKSMQERLASFMYKVYGLMSVAFTITAGTAYYVAHNPTLSKLFLKSPGVFFAILVVQLVLVVGISFLMSRLSSSVATVLFFLYAVSMGLTTSVIFLAYQTSSIYVAFFVSAGMFLVMALYGYFTHTDLSSIGNIVLMALIGLLIGALVNLFLKSTMFDIVLSALGVIIFTALTAYDTQRIKTVGRMMLAEGQEPTKIAVFGALTLYLDFINLFLYMLSLTGRRRD